MMKYKGMRIGLYILTPVLVASVPARVWRQTIPSEAEAFGGAMIAVGILTVLYGWLLVRHMLSEERGRSREQEKQVAQVLCFEAGIVITVAGICFLIRYYVSA
jgi:uncharacterized membrane protein YidH (DUF202 family)